MFTTFCISDTFWTRINSLGKIKVKKVYRPLKYHNSNHVEVAFLVIFAKET